MYFHCISVIFVTSISISLSASYRQLLSQRKRIYSEINRNDKKFEPYKQRDEKQWVEIASVLEPIKLTKYIPKFLIHRVYDTSAMIPLTKDDLIQWEIPEEDATKIIAQIKKHVHPPVQEATVAATTRAGAAAKPPLLTPNSSPQRTRVGAAGAAAPPPLLTNTLIDDFLGLVGLKKYKDFFVKNGINSLQQLFALDNDQLTKIGISSIDDRNKILKLFGRSAVSTPDIPQARLTHQWILKQDSKNKDFIYSWNMQIQQYYDNILNRKDPIELCEVDKYISSLDEQKQLIAGGVQRMKEIIKRSKDNEAIAMWNAYKIVQLTESNNVINIAIKLANRLSLQKLVITAVQKDNIALFRSIAVQINENGEILKQKIKKYLDQKQEQEYIELKKTINHGKNIDIKNAEKIIKIIPELYNVRIFTELYSIEKQYDFKYPDPSWSVRDFKYHVRIYVSLKHLYYQPILPQNSLPPLN